jgi:hypothetical protein
VSQLSHALGYPLQAIHVPKTIDNDLPITDNCPGFGSVAKYVAISTREAALDVASMCSSSTKVFILEVMGRHAGWIAAAAGLAAEEEGDAPHCILFPEIAFDEDKFPGAGQARGQALRLLRGGRLRGHPDRGRQFLSDAGTRDAFGHAQLGGLAPALAQKVKDASATSITGPWPITCSARRATSPRRPMSSRPMPWARPRWKWPWRAKTP